MEAVQGFSEIKEGGCSKAIADTCWALTWKVVDGKKTARSRFVVKGHQAPDLKEDSMDIAGCVSRRSRHVWAISVAAPQQQKIWSLDIHYAFL